jgi:F0F1-type ATP synthase membrane subunit b/b'
MATAEPQEDPPASVEVAGRDGQRLVRISKRTRARPVDPPAPPLTTEPYHTPDDEVPPEIEEPAARARPTIGQIELTRAATEEEDLIEPSASDGVLRTLEDVMGRFPIGDSSGQYSVHVERKRPTAYNGVAARGTLRSITRPIDIATFIEEYGGGDYELIVYGPPRRGGVIEESTGLPRPKALTKPIRLTIPYHGAGGYEPNPEAAFPKEEEEEEDMAMGNQQSGGPAPFPPQLLTRGASPANAKMVESHLTHEERMDQRRREDRQREERQEQSATAATLRVMEQAHQQRESDWREEKRAMATRVTELERLIRESKGGETSALTNLVAAMNPKASSSELEQLRTGHQREMERLTSGHKQEIDNLRRTFQEQTERQTVTARADADRLNDRIRADTETYLRRIKDLEEKVERERKEHDAATDRIRQDLRGEMDRTLDVLKREAERDMQRQKEMYEARLSDERRSAERDDRVRTEGQELRVQSAKAPLESKIAMLEAENRRLKGDVHRYREEAERNRDLGTQIERATKQAELLGFTKDAGGGAGEDEGPQDIGTILTKVGLKVVDHLPELLKSASEAVATVRGGAQRAPVPPPGFGGQELPLPRSTVTQAPPVRQAFMHEDAGPLPPLAADYGTTAYAPVVAPPPLAPMAPPPGMPVAAPSAPPPAREHPATPSQAPPPAPTGQEMVPASPLAPPPAEHPMTEQIVLDARPHLEQAYEQQWNVDELAELQVKQQGAVNVKMALSGLTPQAFSRVLQAHGFENSPLVRASGQRYLRGLHRALVKAVEAAEKGPST